MTAVAHETAPRPTRRPRRARAETPVVEALRTEIERGTTHWYAPAHRGGAGAADDLVGLLGQQAFAGDVALDAATYALLREAAEARAAALWGVDRAFLLVNGATSGNQGMLLAAVGPADAVVVSRDAHPSVHAALVLTGARPVWVSPRVDEASGLPVGLHPDDVARALDLDPAVRAVHVLSPTPAGLCADLEGLRRVTDDRGVALLVDQSHGAHLRFDDRLPDDAMMVGADAAVISPATTLSALSQTAMLLVSGRRLDPARVARAVRMTQTGSPYLPLVASLDSTRAALAADDAASVRRAVDLAQLTRAMVGRVPGLHVLRASDLGLPPRRMDACTVVIDLWGRGLEARATAAVLHEKHAVGVRAADHRRIVVRIGPGDTLATVRHLVASIASVPPARLTPRRSAAPAPVLGPPPEPEPGVLTPRRAWFTAHERVTWDQAEGRVCAELVSPHPSGIAVLAPGEVITSAALAWLGEAVEVGLVAVDLHGEPGPRTLAVAVGA